MRYFILFLLITLTFTVAAQTGNYGVAKRPVKDSNIILPPAWAFGVLYGGYTDQEGTIARIEEIKKHDYPIDAYWIDSWFWSYTDKGAGPKKFIDFTADTISYPNRTNMWRYLQGNNIKGGFWIWDCILETGNETAFNDFKEKGFFSNIFLNTNSWHNGSRSTAMFQDGKEKKGTQCGNIDFDNPHAVAYFKQKMKLFFDEGADFLKLDRTAKISTCKAMFEMSQEFGKETKGRGFMLSHTGGQESEEYKRYPTKWTDDTRSDWTIEKPLVDFNSWVPYVAFKENIAMYTNPKNKISEIPFLTNDLGGFDMGKVKQPDEELYIRWLQLSMFNPITEVFSQPENPTANMAWLYSAKADSIFRYYAHWRMQLFPYIYSYAHRSRIEGKQIMGKIPGYLYEFMFGDEMLLAPVYEKGIATQKVFLPAGNWINYWTGEPVAGNSEYTVPVLLNHIPLFVKQGAIIPMRNYASSVEGGNNNTLLLHIYPGENGNFTLTEDDGISNGYLMDEYAVTKMQWTENHHKNLLRINPPAGTYKGMKAIRKWIIYLHSAKKPLRVKLNNMPIAFRYNKATKTAVVETPSRAVQKTTIMEFSYQ